MPGVTGVSRDLGGIEECVCPLVRLRVQVVQQGTKMVFYLTKPSYWPVCKNNSQYLAKGRLWRQRWGFLWVVLRIGGDGHGRLTRGGVEAFLEISASRVTVAAGYLKSQRSTLHTQSRPTLLCSFSQASLPFPTPSVSFPLSLPSHDQIRLHFLTDSNIHTRKHAASDVALCVSLLGFLGPFPAVRLKAACSAFLHRPPWPPQP